MKTAIMTDTNSGITKNIAEKLGIYVIHMPVIIEETTFYENDTITEEEFFHALSTGKHITTSQPSPGDVIDLWDQILADGYDELVYIPMSSGLSNSCAAAIGYSQDYEGKVEVIDNVRVGVTKTIRKVGRPRKNPEGTVAELRKRKKSATATK